MTAYAAVALVAVAVGASGTAFAQLAPAPVAPGRIEQPLQQRPAAPLPGGGVDMPMIPNTGPAPAGAESTHFVLRGVQITGVTVYPEGTFNDLYSGLIGKDVTLAQIYSVGQAITARYRGDGYIISQAVLPAQQITNGNVRIVVVEGFVDKVIVKDEKTGSTGEDRSVLDRMAQKISNDRPLTAKALERYMLLINDLPGVTARSFLAPSATTPGAADLTIVLNDKKYDGYLSTDNLGSKFVGPGEFAVAGNLDNAFGIWERTGLRYVGTYDVSELQYAEFTHEEQIGSEGGKVDLQAFRSNSEPGDLLSPLHSNALNWTGLAIFSYPFIRSRSENLSVHGTVQITNIDSTQLGITTTQDRLRVLRFGANYNKVDTWLGTEGVSLVSGELSQGLPGLGSTTSSDTLKSRQGADGEFTKFFGEVQRSQALWGNFGLLVAVQGQYAFDNLLSPEQFGVGGALYGRGWYPSQILGDDGVAAKAELQYGESLGLNWLRDYQLFGFYDIGYVHFRSPPVGKADNHLQSAGVGVRLNFTDRLSGFGEIAKQFSSDAAIIGESGYAWRGQGGVVFRF